MDHADYEQFFMNRTVYSAEHRIRSVVEGSVYTVALSDENGTKSCRFSLPFTPERYRNRHQMKTIF